MQVSLLPHQQRVVDERAQLAERLSKLGMFIDSASTFIALDAADRKDLILQRANMETLRDVLDRRIARFTP